MNGEKNDKSKDLVSAMMRSLFYTLKFKEDQLKTLKKLKEDVTTASIDKKTLKKIDEEILELQKEIKMLNKELTKIYKDRKSLELEYEKLRKAYQEDKTMRDHPDLDYTFKLLIFGDASSGKKELLNKFASKYFQESLNLIFGIEFYTKTISFNREKIKMHLWDIGGEKRFRFLLSQYSKGAHGVIFLYDITDLNSLKHVPEWVQKIRENAGEIPILLVGNYLDLEQNREVSKEQIEILKKLYDISSSMEISVKTGENVEKMFLTITEMMLEQY